MASRKEEKAEGAARYAADEIKSDREAKESSNLPEEQQHVRKEQYGVSLREETHTQEHKPGLISSVIGALGSTYEHAKEAVTGKTHDAAEKTKETAESVSESMKESHDIAAEHAREDAVRAREGKDNAAESLRQTKDYTVGTIKDKAVQAKDVTVGKTKDTAGYVADKAVQAKDAAVGKTKDTAGYVADKAGQAKDETAEKAQQMKDYTAKEKTMEAKEMDREAMESAAENKESVMEEEAKIKSQDVYKDTEEEARSKMEELWLKKLSERGCDVEDEAAERAKADRETAALRGKAAANNIVGTMGSVTEAMKSKLTMPSDILEEKQGTRGQSGGENIGES